MLSIKKIWKAVFIVMTFLATLSIVGCGPESIFIDKTFGGYNPIIHIKNTTVTAGAIVIEGEVDGGKNIENLKYKLFVENSEGEIKLEPEMPILSENIEANDGSFDAYHDENIKIQLPMLSFGRYKIIYEINGCNREEFNQTIIINKQGELVKDRAVTNISNNSIRTEFLPATQEEYSFVIYKIDNGIRTIIKTGSSTLQEEAYRKYCEINFSEGNSSGYYEIRFYKETLEEINGNYDDFVCINSEIKKYKFLF